jgi:hypothetical protein
MQLHLTEATARSPFFMSLVDSQKTFSRRPIKMMQVLDNLKFLISISGEEFSLFIFKG